MHAADRTITADGDLNNLDAIQAFSVACLRREQDQDLRSFSVLFDRYFLESSLYESGAVATTVTALEDNGHTYAGPRGPMAQND